MNFNLTSCDDNIEALGTFPYDYSCDVVTWSSLFSVRRCEVVDDRPFPLSETVYNTFVFGGRSVVSEHIGYYTDRKGNDIVLEKKLVMG